MSKNQHSVSNIAWPSESDGTALDLVAELGFSGVELAPGKVFGPLDALDGAVVRDYVDELTERGLEISALQSILFGVTDVSLFGSTSQQDKLFDALFVVAQLAGRLGGLPCVFGAPSLRDPGQLDQAEAWKHARVFFSRVAPIFEGNGSILCFEANPAIYNNKFVTHTAQAARLVADISSPGFKLQFDTGTVFANSELDDLDTDLLQYAAHLHVSEPNLVPVGSAGSAHGAIGLLLEGAPYQGWMSVEMRSSDYWRDNLIAAKQLLDTHYSGSPV